MDRCRDIPVIMLTSKQDKASVVESSKLGVFDFSLPVNARAGARHIVLRGICKYGKLFHDRLHRRSPKFNTGSRVSFPMALTVRCGEFQAWCF